MSKHITWSNRLILSVLLSVLLFLVSAERGYSSPVAEIPTVQVAPDFHLKSLTGQDVILSELKGKVVVVNFWATWCGPCRVEIPHLKSIYQEYREKGFEIIGISLDMAGEKVVRPFVEKNKIEYPIAIGDQELVKKYGGITGIPTTFIIDRDGNIRHKWVGYRSEKDFHSAIAPLLDSKNTE